MQFLIDVHGQISFLSEEWQALTGQPVAASKALGWLEKVHPEDRQPIADGLSHAFASRSQFILRFRVACDVDGYSWFVSSGAPSMSPLNGTFIGYLGLMRLIENAAEMVHAEVEVGSPRPPSKILDEIGLSALENLADEVIHARILAQQANDEATRRVLDLALIEVGYRLAEERANGTIGKPENIRPPN